MSRVSNKQHYIALLWLHFSLLASPGSEFSLLLVDLLR